MHVRSLFHKLFKEQLPKVHQTRLTSLMEVCSTAVNGNSLSLTSLGRSLSNNNKESSNIQRVDRLLGNSLLQTERGLFYKVMCSLVLQKQSSPWIHIDWTCINSTTNVYALRASLSMKGRSLVLYEESYPKKQENNHATHKDFLTKLKHLLPPDVKPVIVTDAGFRGPWFSYLLQLGWDFVGRLRNKNLIFLDKHPSWCLSSTYFAQATNIPTCIGQGLLTQEGKVPVQFVLYKGLNKGNHFKKSKKSGNSKRYSKANKEPWLLVTSLPAKQNPLLITNIYRQRMRIEENIRDTKCPHYGLGLRNSLTRSPQRMNILLLIAALATFAAWLAGLFIQHNGKAADFQAQSAKVTNALSSVFLGRRALNKGLSMTWNQFKAAISLLYLTASQVQREHPQYG